MRWGKELAVPDIKLLHALLAIERKVVKNLGRFDVSKRLPLLEVNTEQQDKGAILKGLKGYFHIYDILWTYII